MFTFTIQKMGTFVYLICIAVASFTVLAQPAVAQGANTTLPLSTLNKSYKEMADRPAPLRSSKRE